MTAIQQSDHIEVDLTNRIARRRRTAIVLVLLGIAATITLYFVPPAQSPIYPPCPLQIATGWHCPGCGATRCLHALLHGRIADAASYNILFLLVLPIIVMLIGRALFAALAGNLRRSRPVPTWMLLVFAIVLVAYGIIRNVDHPLLGRLAPGRLFPTDHVANQAR